MICRFFRRWRKESPEYYVIPGTRIVADRIEPPELAYEAHYEILVKILFSVPFPKESPDDIRFYLVRDEFLEGPDGRMRVPFGDQTYAVHGYTVGRRIILTPHGASSLATIEHEIRHVYGESHNERGEWLDE